MAAPPPRSNGAIPASSWCTWAPSRNRSFRASGSATSWRPQRCVRRWRSVASPPPCNPRWWIKSPPPSCCAPISSTDTSRGCGVTTGGRRAALLAALEAHMPAGVRYAEPAGGNGVWVRLPPGSDVAAVAQCASERGIALDFGPSFGAGADDPALFLSCASEPPEQLDRAVAELAQCVDAAEPTTPGAH